MGNKYLVVEYLGFFSFRISDGIVANMNDVAKA